MKKFLAHFLVFTLIFSFIVFPNLGHAQNFNLIVCDGVQKPCDFNLLMKMLKNFINALIVLATLATTIALIYIGFLLVMPSANVNNKNEAKRIAWSVMKGYLWILAGWFVVYTIFSTLLDEEYLDAFK